VVPCCSTRLTRTCLGRLRRAQVIASEHAAVGSGAAGTISQAGRRYARLVVARPLVPAVEGTLVSVGAWLERQVELLIEAHGDGERVAAELLRGTGVLQGPDEELLAARLEPETAREAIACDHGYAGWADATAHADEPVDTGFEAAADAIQWGELETLSELLDAHPELVRMRSPFVHRAMLLHHVAANGIEIERQLQSPSNAVAITRLLLERGAEPDAMCLTYGGGRGQTTLYLLVSSAPPAAVGVQAALVEELCRGGARVEGLDDDGWPLWTAITFGYTEAAEALVRCGARVDNIVFAAALGDLDAVERYFDSSGQLRSGLAGIPRRLGPNGPPADPDRIVDYALIQAAAHNRRKVVEFLLTKGPDLEFREPFFDATASGVARYFGNDAIVALLDAPA
jgi:hypothetical protein